MHIFELTRQLMEIESVTGNDAAVGYFLRDYLSSLKHDVSLQEAAENRFNVMAFAGDPDLVFSTQGVLAGRADLRHLFEVPPFLMSAVEGFETAVLAFATDVPFLTGWGKPFLLGPGSILNAHTDHERISKQELRDGVELYIRLGKILLS